MKKQIFAVIFALGISVAVNAGQTYAQSMYLIRVDVPFAFSANNETLPAGTYIIKPVTDNRITWRIESANQKPSALLMAKVLSGSERSGDMRLTFRRYGNRNFLAGFTTTSYQVELPTSNSEKNLRRSSETSPGGRAKSDVVTVAAVPKN